MKIDFYILSDSSLQADWLFACKLIEKAYELGHEVYVLCNNQADAFAFDELLWTFNPESFIPHHIQGEGPKPIPPVQIGFEDKAPNIRNLFINLSSRVPPFFQQFQRICEIVPDQEQQKTIKREHYKLYQGHQLKIDTHKIS